MLALHLIAKVDYRLLNVANCSIRSLLREGHLLLLFSHCILFHKRGLGRAKQIHRPVIESGIRSLIHIVQRGILVGVNSANIDQIGYVLLITQVVVRALTPDLAIFCHVLALTHPCQASSGRVLACLSCLWRETM